MATDLHAQTRGTKLEGDLRIAEGLDVVFIGANEVLIQHGSRSLPSELFRDTDLTGVLRRVLYPLQHEALDYTALLNTFDASTRAEAQAILDELIDKGVVVSTLSNAVEQYLGYALNGNAALGTFAITVVGAGPLGARIAATLLQHGVGELRLLDDRPADHLWNGLGALGHYEPASPHTTAQDALKAFLERTGSAQVETFEGGFSPSGVSAAVAGSNLTLLATEQPNPALAHLVNRHCLRDHCPWLLAGIDGSLGLVGPLFDPPDTACYNDYEVLSQSISANPAMDRLYHRYLLDRHSGSFFAGLPAYVDIVSGFGALAAVHFLVAGTCSALGRLTAIDFQEMRVDCQDVLKLPRCPVCGSGGALAEPTFPLGSRPDLEQ